MSGGRPRRSLESLEGLSRRPRGRAPRLPLGSLDPAIIDRARAINADALKAIHDLLARTGDTGRG